MVRFDCLTSVLASVLISTAARVSPASRLPLTTTTLAQATRTLQAGHGLGRGVGDPEIELPPQHRLLAHRPVLSEGVVDRAAILRNERPRRRIRRRCQGRCVRPVLLLQLAEIEDRARLP